MSSSELTPPLTWNDDEHQLDISRRQLRINCQVILFTGYSRSLWRLFRAPASLPDLHESRSAQDPNRAQLHFTLGPRVTKATPQTRSIIRQLSSLGDRPPFLPHFQAFPLSRKDQRSWPVPVVIQEPFVCSQLFDSSFGQLFRWSIPSRDFSSRGPAR